MSVAHDLNKDQLLPQQQHLLFPDPDADPTHHITQSSYKKPQQRPANIS